jgi:hypothetical protein
MLQIACGQTPCPLYETGSPCAIMPLSDPIALHKLFRRHAHDVRNHCSGIDLDATLLAELGGDPETAAIATRLKKQVARIEADLRLLLLKLEDPQTVTLTLGDLLQLWRMKLQPLDRRSSAMVWPEIQGGPSISLDTRLTVQVLCNLAIKIWDCHPDAAIEVVPHVGTERVVLDLVLPPDGPGPPADYVKETSAVLAAGGLGLALKRQPPDDRWLISLEIPLVVNQGGLNHAV